MTVHLQLWTTEPGVVVFVACEADEEKRSRKRWWRSRGNRESNVNPGFYTFVRHLGKMGPPSSLLFLTVDGEQGGEIQTGEKQNNTRQGKGVWQKRREGGRQGERGKIRQTESSKVHHHHLKMKQSKVGPVDLKQKEVLKLTRDKLSESRRERSELHRWLQRKEALKKSCWEK